MSSTNSQCYAFEKPILLKTQNEGKAVCSYDFVNILTFHAHLFSLTAGRLLLFN